MSFLVATAAPNPTPPRRLLLLLLLSLLSSSSICLAAAPDVATEPATAPPSARASPAAPWSPPADPALWGTALGRRLALHAASAISHSAVYSYADSPSPLLGLVAPGLRTARARIGPAFTGYLDDNEARQDTDPDPDTDADFGADAGNGNDCDVNNASPRSQPCSKSQSQSQRPPLPPSHTRTATLFPKSTGADSSPSVSASPDYTASDDIDNDNASNDGSNNSNNHDSTLPAARSPGSNPFRPTLSRRERLASSRARALLLLRRSYGAYARHALPFDELRPLTASRANNLIELGGPGPRQSAAAAYPGLALTLVDALSTLAVAGAWGEVSTAARWLDRWVGTGAGVYWGGDDANRTRALRVRSKTSDRDSVNDDISDNAQYDDDDDGDVVDYDEEEGYCLDLLDDATLGDSRSGHRISDDEASLCGFEA